jgi:hypothetical protein
MELRQLGIQYMNVASVQQQEIIENSPEPSAILNQLSQCYQ